MRTSNGREVDGVVERQDHARAERCAEFARAPSNVKGMSSASGPRTVRRHRRAARPAACRCLRRRRRGRARRGASGRTAPRRRRDGRRGPTYRTACARRRPLPVRAKASPPSQHDREDVHERLDVVLDRWLSEQPDVGGKRRLAPWLPSIPLDRVEQRRLLAADVRAGALAAARCRTAHRGRGCRHREAVGGAASIASASRRHAIGYSPRT